MIIKHFYTVWQLLKDERVKLSTKVVFILVSIGYAIAPVIPFMPLDDFFFIYIASLVFKHIASKQAGINTKQRTYYNKKKDKVRTIDVEGKIIDE
jgi:hypothetical protein